MLKVVGASWSQIRLSSWIIGVVIVLGIVAIIVTETGRTNDDGTYSATVSYTNGVYNIEFWGQGTVIEQISPGVARAHYDPRVKLHGWALLQVETQPKYPDEVQAFAAGYAEGALSWQMIYWHWKNTVSSYCDNQLQVCSKIRAFLHNNMEWVMEHAKANNGDPYWHQVHLFYKQLEGVKFGFDDGVRRSRQDIDEITPVDFIWMNSISDLADLTEKVSSSGTVKRWAYFNPQDAQHRSNMHSPEQHQSNMQSALAISHYGTVHTHIKTPDPGASVDCGYKGIPLSSSFIKFVPQREKLYVAHNSAGSYSQMLKVFKRYELRYHQTEEAQNEVIGSRISFSSYPAAVHSMDDFYIVGGNAGHSLSLAATPLTVFNQHLWHLVNAKHQVLMGPRSLAALRLASNASDWVQIFSRYNSGTGNKAWSVIDMGLFERASADRHNPNRYTAGNLKNLLWVLEQLPGNITASEQTEHLLADTYWATYGIPYHEAIFNLSGTAEMLKLHGNVFSYEQTALANIFRRDHHNVTDMQTALKLMRSNLYKVDPLSEGNPRCAVGSRGDVDSSDNAEPVGVTDIKVLRSNPPILPFVPVRNNTARMHISYPRLYISAGPVFGGAATPATPDDDLQPFSWSSGNFSSVSHVGQPDTWMFDPIPVLFV